MKIKIVWYDASGERSGTEKTTIQKLWARLDGKAQCAQKLTNGVEIWRLPTGEVARCHASKH